jgi:dolichol-phosphate mannosyltransferase
MSRLTETEIPLDTGDFRLMDRKVVDALAAMPERDRFVRGLVSWTGFRQIGVPYRRAARFAGTSKYPLTKMLGFAMDGIASFSVKPLTATTYVGFGVAGLAVLGIVYALVLRFFTDIHVPGWTALFIAVLFLGGVQLISLGIMGEYVGRIYGEAKRRPLYLLQERLGFNRPVSTPTLVRDQVFRERRSGERRRQDSGWRRSGESLSVHNA